MKIIFLDVDGVLNGYGPVIGIFYKIAKRLHITRWTRRVYDVTALHKMKVWILSRIVNKTDAFVVIISASRGKWMLTENNDEQVFKQHRDFKNLMKHFQIPILDLTPNINNEKYLEIQEWMKYHPRITSYCIIDDECDVLKKYFPDNTICTKDKNKFRSGRYANTGLKLKHIKQAIQILNKEDRDEETN